MSGLRNETACPAKVARPAEEPAEPGEAGREGIAQRALRGCGIHQAAAGNGDGGGLAEALLIDFRVGGVGAGDGQVGNGHWRDEDAEGSAEYGLAFEDVRRPGEARARADDVGIVLIDGVVARVGEGEAAEHVERAHRNLGNRRLGVGCRGGGRERIRRGGVEAVDRASPLLVVRRVVIEAHAEVDGQVRLDAPIVLHEAGAVVGIPGTVGIQVVGAAIGQAQEEGGKILAHHHGG